MDNLLIALLMVFVPVTAFFFFIVWNERKERRAHQMKR